MRRLSNPDRSGMETTSLKWKCLNCGEVYEFTLPRTCPAPCRECGSDAEFFTSGIK